MKRKLSPFEKFVTIGIIVIALIGISYFIAEKEAYNEKQKLINSNLQMEFETVVWNDGELMKLIPAPKSNIGKIERNDKKGFSAYVGETSIDEFEKYANACSKSGFTVDAEKEGKSFSAKNKDSYTLKLDYKGNNIFYISINEPEFEVDFEVECVENLMFSQYDVEIYVDDSFKGILEHGDTDTYSASLPKGTHTIKFVNYDDEKVNGKVKIDIQKDEKLKFKISCTSSRVNVKTIKGTVAKKETAKANADSSKKKKKTESSSKDSSNTSTITMPHSYTYYIGRQYKEVEKELKKLGFKKFDYHKVEINEENEVAGEIKEIYAEDWIFTDKFKKGDTYDSACTIKVYYYVNPPKLKTLTIENCPDLNSLLTGKEDYSVYSNFASKYSGQLIEFDGRIDYIVNYKDYNTRYELLISAGDYDPNSQTGPSFKFEDVNSFDLGLDTMYIDDEIWVGRNVHIIAEVEEFNSNTGLFYLDPVSVIGR